MFATSPTRRTQARRFGPFVCAFVALLLAIDARGQEKGWVSLFNGKDLDGWTPKIQGHAAGGMAPRRHLPGRRRRSEGRL